MWEWFLLGVCIGVLLGAAIVGIVLGGSVREREIQAYRNGYRAGLEDRDA